MSEHIIPIKTEAVNIVMASSDMITMIAITTTNPIVTQNVPYKKLEFLSSIFLV